uniref:IRS-type PTB domain-containing protein n=1 Tax=Panagrellus redivivus TaxID=6233 RepID=A0A7E4WBL5_PANRE
MSDIGTLSRDAMSKMGTVQIPRPKCSGFQFVPTRGRMGFYRSIKRDGEKYGIQMKNQGPRRPTLPDANFWQQPAVSEANNNNNEKTESVGTSETQQHVDANGNNLPIKKQPPPAPPLPKDSARLPPRPPRGHPAPPPPQMLKGYGKSHFAPRPPLNLEPLIEPPVDYDDDDTPPAPTSGLRRGSHQMYRPHPILEEVENELPNRGANDDDRFYSERF